MTSRGERLLIGAGLACALVVFSWGMGCGLAKLSATPTIRVDASLQSGHMLRDTTRELIGTEGAPGPELVTEEYLQRQISERMSDELARPFAYLWTRANWPTTISRVSSDWPKREWGYRLHNAHAYAFNVLEGQAFAQDLLFISLPSPVYDGGDVKTGHCRTLPNSGVVQTGDYQVIDNTDGDADVERTLETTVSDTLDEAITLNESVEFSNSTTVEAGADIGGVSGSASDTFSETLGIDKSKTEDHSTTTTRTVTTDWAVEPASKSVAVFTADRTVIDCHVEIGADLNWPGLTIRLGRGFQPLTGVNELRGRGVQWEGDNHVSRLLQDVTERGVVSFPAGGGVEDVWRFLKGYDVRGGAGLRNQGWTPAIAAAIEGYADPTNRFLSFNGTRRSVSNDSASVTFVDVTGLSDGEIDRRYGQAGAPVGGQQ